MQGGHYKNQGIHKGAKDAGSGNLQKATMKQLRTDIEGVGTYILEIYSKGLENTGTYKGQYTGEELLNESNKFLLHCAENQIKPTPPLYILWLNIDPGTMSRWKNDSKYDLKHTIVKKIYLVMEAYLQANIDKNPTGNIFLLKTSHGHVEASKLDITSNGKDVTDASEVEDLVKRLGLNEKDNSK